MAGSMLWNVLAGCFGAVLVFFLSNGGNPLSTAGTRAMYSFAIMFAVTFAVRWLLHQAFASHVHEETAARIDANDDVGKGGSIDLTTPPDDETEGFAPLVSPKLASVKSMDSEQIAKTIRNMSVQ